MDICLAEKKDALEVAKTHKEEIKNGFLSSFNTFFLRKFYEAIFSSKHSFCVVAKEGAAVIGFVSGVSNINYFYKYFFRKHFFIFVPVFLPKIFNRSFVKKVFESVFYPQKTKGFPEPELLTFAVKREYQGRGIGKGLLRQLIEEFKKRQIRVFKVLVGSEMNSVGFYKKNGFQVVKEINLHGDEKSLVLIYKIK